MNAVMSKLSPSATTMIRMDHTHVLAVSHRYKLGISHVRKHALVTNACLALEVHAQLEEEIFYPALREAIGQEPTLDKAVPEHDEMKRLIGQLRAMTPDDPEYDRTFMDLMRDVIHHVADEETILLPLAERTLGPRVYELGARMTRRRLQLVAPRARELATSTARSFPVGSFMVAAGAFAVGAAWLLAHQRHADHAAMRHA